MNPLAVFWPKIPTTLVYMLQQSEYDAAKFAKWVYTAPNLLRIQKRGHLQLTARTKLMLAVAYSAFYGLLLGGLLGTIITKNILFILLSVWAPMVTIFVIFVSTLLLQKAVVAPKEQASINIARHKLEQLPATRIAVLGSYGKTSMKELLVTILSEGKKVAATPGNKNVLISHARWINGVLTGKEDALIFEYGEGKTGDIKMLANLSKPTMAVVTGLAPAHLDEYDSLTAIADDFADISSYVKPEHLYVSDTSNLLTGKVKGTPYSYKGVGSMKVSNVKVDFTGTSFTLTADKKKLKLDSGLIGAHHIGPLCAAVQIALNLGLSDAQIVKGVADTKPYEHRLQPRVQHGAWIIDDTYNGTIEGMRAGLELLKILPAKRRIYVTPGLVDQGKETEAVHKELGNLIAKAHPDKVVLMQNSATDFIIKGLKAGNYKGELTIESNPLDYYTNLEHFLAAGDVFMLQNDWPDSYK